MASKGRKVSPIPQYKLMEYAVRVYHALLAKKIRTDAIILYGSQAKGNPHADSDIDFAVISRDFGRDQIKDNITVNGLAAKIDARISVVTFGFDDFFAGKSYIPLKHEIMKHGVCLI
jgi:predicted nucleotidyltransferase